MKLLTCRSSAEWARRIMWEISQVSRHSCPAHGTAYSSSTANAASSVSKHFDETKCDYAFEVATTTVRYGRGVVRRELHHDIAALCPDVKDKLRVVVFTDKLLSRYNAVKTVLGNLERNGILFELYDDIKVEPTNDSLVATTDFLKAMKPCHAVIAVGGGSVIDTAKGANLLSSPGIDSSHLMDYVNAPIGKGKPIENEELRPLIAIPTTTGTGSETTGTVVFDIPHLRAKSGISHRRLRPTLALLEPDNSVTQPTSVMTYSGFDVLSHALESFTAVAYDERKPRPLKPSYRPAYQGSNPVSDLWARETLRLISENLIDASNGVNVQESRPAMQLAAAYGGFGFGNAGCHLCHAMSYPISGQVKSYHAEDYPTTKALIPHGLSVIVNAPAVFTFTGPACPDRHLEGARILGGKNFPVSPNARREDAGKILADVVRGYMSKLGIPNGLSALGFSKEDVPSLVEGTLPQHRLTKLSPQPAARDALEELFENSIEVY